MRHLEFNNLLTNNQHGFRRRRSCEGQLISVIQNWSQILDQRNTRRHIDAIFLDFSKAFDTVPHKRLLRKLCSMGIKGELLQWIENFLSDRQQRVVLNGFASDWTPVISGVPQGTVLGPCLFLCYINDITNEINSKISLFADDALIFRQIASNEDIHVLQQDLDVLEKWSTDWLLAFNVSKCVHIQLHPTRLQKINTSYSLNNKQIPQSNSTKYLGVEIQQDLGWTNHIHNITSKANRTLGCIRRNFSKADKDVRKNLFISLVRPQLEYASAAWDPSKQKDINTLEMIQNRSLRFIHQDYGRTSSITNMRNMLKIQSLEERRSCKRIQCFYEFRKKLLILNDLPALSPKRTFTRQSHQHNDVLTIPFQPNTDYLRHSFLYRTINSWNVLPLRVIEGSKTHLKKYLVNQNNVI